ncbi:hypothetical protein GGX14DRAFT_398491 [Mycena pura]|uniref:Uncharacterized protein n=1 Tax=Mycena pura TaxID=153505 RepID=A0AAD6VDT3_9AGAR|nr:hypothetical protein GGX14DRAFT_398491 [Mycena pura]
MSDHRTTNTIFSSPSGKRPRPASQSNSDWLGPIMVSVQVVTASVGVLPFPYVKGVLETVKTVLDAVEVCNSMILTHIHSKFALQKVKKNRDTLKELCEDIAEIASIVQDKLSAYGNNVAEEMVCRCKEFDTILQDVLVVVHNMQKTRSIFKEMLQSSNIMDDIMKYQEKIKKLQSNFMLITAMDTFVAVKDTLVTVKATNDQYVSW